MTKPGFLKHACTVCRAEVRSGGRKTAPALCARCYKREQRGAPPRAEVVRALGLTERLEVNLTPAMRRQVDKKARELGFTFSEWVRSLLLRALEARP